MTAETSIDEVHGAMMAETSTHKVHGVNNSRNPYRIVHGFMMVKTSIDESMSD